jgi:PAS domain S-box-containing protein
MIRKWTILKNIISKYEKQEGIFLSLINDDGQIVCANARMIKTLHLKNPREVNINLFDLIQPVCLLEFKSAIQTSLEKKEPFVMQLALKNGLYHPMKWQVNLLERGNGKSNKYLCVGHKITTDERAKKFNYLSEKNYHLINEGLNVGILFQDRDGELIAVNQQLAEIFKTTLDNIYQITNLKEHWDTFWQIKSEIGRPVSFDNSPFMKAIAKKELQTGVLAIQLKNGEVCWFSFNSQPLFNENELLPFAVVSTIKDITQEKKLKDQLAEKDALYEVFMKQTFNLAWVVDEDSNLIFANQSFYRYFNLMESDSIGRKILELLPALFADPIFGNHIKLFETGSPVDVIEKIKLSDVENVVFHINIFPIQGVTSKKMYAGHAVNITDKWEAEKKIKEVNDRLLILTKATFDGIWEWDMQSGKIFRNDALMNIIGYQHEHTKGLSWWFRRIHPEDRNRVSDTVKVTAEKNLLSWEEQYRFRCADGYYKHIRDRGYIVYESGLPVIMIGFLQDISNLKQLENQLVEEKLEKQKEISETIIRVQEKERTRIGHELHDNVNQILSTVKLFVDMITPISSEQEPFKEKSLQYILLAIEEIRKLSKEMVEPQLQNAGLIKSVNSLIEDIHLSTNININFSYDEENEYLSPGKKITLFRIIQEQLKNVLNHSKAKKVEICLRTNEKDIQLQITDDGIGFFPRKSHRGIGLSNIYERTRFYNGYAEIQSSPGKGCTMIVNIPYA